MEGFESVEKASYYVVSARSLSAGENDGDMDGFCKLFPFSRGECQQRHVAGGGEFRRDFFGIGKCREFFTFGAYDIGAGLE